MDSSYRLTVKETEAEQCSELNRIMSPRGDDVDGCLARAGLGLNSFTWLQYSYSRVYVIIFLI